MGGFLGKSATVLVLAATATVAYLHFRHANRVDYSTGPPVPVLVAKAQIRKGTPGSVIGTKALYRLKVLAPGKALKGALVDPSTLGGKVALVNIRPGQQLTLADFGTATR